MTKSRIVLGTPIGIDRTGKYLINYPSRWAASVERSPFYFYPFTLGYAASLVKLESSYNVLLIDAGLAGLDQERYLDRLILEEPDVFVMETASRTYEEDLSVALRLKKALGTTIVFVGQHPSAFPGEVARQVDFVIVGEFERPLVALLDALRREVPVLGIAGVYPTPSGANLADVDDLPWPEDEDVSRIDYAGPLPGHRYRQIQLYASRGCPIMCNFCVASHVYYRKANWRPRKPDDIVAEILHLARKYEGRFDGIFFDDEIHVVSKKQILDLCDRLIAHGLHGLKHTAMGAYYTLDEEILTRMVKAGYRQLKIGIETADEATAQASGLKSKFAIEKLLEVLHITRDLGISVYGTFQVGCLGSSMDSDRRTADLVGSLLGQGLLDEMQVSIATPQPGTPFYDTCRRNGYLVTDDFTRYDGSDGSVVSYPGYSKKQIDDLYGEIVHLGHHLRGLRDIERHGLVFAARRAISRVGVGGLLRHAVARLDRKE